MRRVSAGMDFKVCHIKRSAGTWFLPVLPGIGSYCTFIPGSVSGVQPVYFQAGAGAQTGSRQHYKGEYHRPSAGNGRIVFAQRL